MPARIVHVDDNDATCAVDVELIIVTAAVVVFVVRHGAVVAFVLVGRIVLIVAALELVRGQLAGRRIVLFGAASAKQQLAAIEWRSTEEGQVQLERGGEGVVDDRARAASAQRRADRHACSRYHHALWADERRRRPLSQGKT
jgi:hypothetical protein